MFRPAWKITFLICLGVHASFAAKTSRPLRPYAGISDEQSNLAHNALDAFFNGNSRESERILYSADSLEDQNQLPPLSRLLQVATSVIQLQRNETGNEKEEKHLRKLIADAAKEGLDDCKKARKESDSYPTYLLMQGGIQGFTATLKISSSPAKALSEGLHALKFLEEALDIDSTLMDANMGLGIFQCTAANAPVVVRGTLKMLGRPVNMEEGLNILRHAAYQGQYTSVASQLFLIQFLSPYNDDLRSEKREIFRSLSKSYPQSAYYAFVRWDEALCFYPDSFFLPRARRSLEHRMRDAVPHDYAGERYLNLIKYQYTLLNRHPGSAYAPDTTFDLHEYAFYPVFVEALRLRRKIMADSGDPSRSIVRNMRDLRDSALDLIDESKLNTANIHLYKWHMRDALRTKVWRKKSSTALDDSDSTED